MEHNRVSLQCDVCCKQFSGPVPAHQHFNSAEHRRKVEISSKEHKGFFCQACNKTCDTQNILDLHNQSPRHLAMVQKQKSMSQQAGLAATGHTSPGTTESPSAGISNEHIDQVYMFNSDTQTGFCYICHLDLTSGSHAMDHLKGKPHLKKRRQIETERFHASSPMVQDHITRNSLCAICKVGFTGPQSAKDHYSSEKHKKKEAIARYDVAQDGSLQNRNEPVAGSSIMQSNTMCDLCQVSLTGPESAQQHYAGEKHKKNVRAKEKRDRGDLLPLKCNACNCVFSGQENAEAHFSSKKHKRNEENMNIRGLATHNTMDALTREAGGSINTKESQVNLPPQFSRPNIGPAKEPFDVNIHRDNGDNKFYRTETFSTENSDYESNSELNAKPFPIDERTLENNEESYSELNAKPLTSNVEVNVNKAPFGMIESTQNGVINSTIVDTDTQLHQTTRGITSPAAEPDQEARNIPKINLLNMEENDNASHRQHYPDASRQDGLNSQMSMRDEEKIRAETHTSITGSGQYTDSLFSKDDCTSTESSVQSLRDVEPVKFVRNDLNNFSSTPVPSFGRGRGFWQLSSQQNNPTLGKLLNRNRISTLDSNKTPEIKIEKTHGFDNDTTQGHQHDDESTKLLTIWSNDDTRQTQYEVYSKVCDEESEGEDENNRFVAERNLRNENEDLLTKNQTPELSSRQELAIEQNEKRKSSSDTDGISTVEEFHFSNTTERGRCNVCSIELTSKNHMRQHLGGRNHTKTKLVWQQMITEEFERNPFICKICRVSFSGDEPRNQHFQSQKHKAKELEFTSGGQEFFCDICKITCTGNDSFEQHLSGAQHQKMMNFKIHSGNNASSPLDKTNWYPCEVCGCSLNTLEQLRIHEESPRHLAKLSKQHPGKIEHDFVYSRLNQEPFVNIDKTVWYPCRVCNCQLNTHEQLLIHEKSPRHLANAVKSHHLNGFDNSQQNAPFNANSPVWYPCHVCQCQLNTQEQLLIHEKSPKHLAKLRSIQPNYQTSIASQPFKQTLPTTNHDKKNDSSNSIGCVTPLDNFLSEELFPEEFMPKIERIVIPTHVGNESKPFLLEMSKDPVPIPPRFALLSEAKHSIEGEDENDMPGRGSSRRGQGSDLAWATRNKGSGNERGSVKADGPRAGTSTQDSRMLYTSNFCDQSTAETNDCFGARAKDGSSKVVNPYEATHPYYCHTCKAPMNTRESYETHLKGKRHLHKISTEAAPLRTHLPPCHLGSQFMPQTTTSPRNYQQELYQKTMATDSLCFLPTGTGKTLVAVMTISAMLEKCPSKNVLFLVDKVLLVLQQSRYINSELQDKHFPRCNPDSATQVERRPVRVAAVCMGQQNTGGVPLWKHDVVVITAAFCKNLLDNKVLYWKDFSLVVFDEAHHCEKSHPFSVLLREYHSPIYSAEERPKVLGLTASPAGKDDVPKTLLMLQSLILNMGGVRMCVVENPRNVQTLKEIQSNAQIVIRPQAQLPSDGSEEDFRNELRIYILQCFLKLLRDSNIKLWVDMGRNLDMSISESEIPNIAILVVETNLDQIQNCLGLIKSDTLDKVTFSLLTTHVQYMCMTWNSFCEGGIICALEEIAQMESELCTFEFARSIGLPCEALQKLVPKRSDECTQKQDNVNDAQANIQVQQLIDELTGTSSLTSTSKLPASKTISLVLVKERGTAHRITKMLQNCDEMRRYGLSTVTVVGHGGGGSGERGMSVNQQKRVLEEIKQYKYQVIVATSVAEEGVDWPECERVISMYPPSTVTALVQMRGRARKKNSRFIVLCASQDEEEKLNDIINREKNMIIATKILVEQETRHAEENLYL